MAEVKRSFKEEPERERGNGTIEPSGDPEEHLPLTHCSKTELDKMTIFRKRTKHMKKYPELYRSDVSINPSYTGLRNLPYYVVCRRRYHKKKAKIIRQLNREIAHIAMMQTFAIDSVRLDRVFSVGIPLKAVVVKDFATSEERRRINHLLGER